MTTVDCNRIDWNALDAGARDEVLQRPTRASSALVRGDVQSILEDVAARGDAALRVLTAHHDGVELERHSPIFATMCPAMTLGASTGRRPHDVIASSPGSSL